MNEIGEIINTEPRSQSTALAVLPPATLPTIMAAPGAADILDKLVEDLSGFHGDVTTEKGRKEIASKSRKAAVAKMDLIRLADGLKEGAQKTIKGVNAEVKIITERMDALRDQIRAPLDEFEAMEEARVKAHQDAVTEIEGWASIPETWTAEQIGDRLAELSAHALLGRDWQEFKGRAQQAATNSFNALKVAHAEAVKREAEAAEAERLRQEVAERERQEQARLQAEREAEIARQAAEAARLEAERVAAEQAATAERAAQAERDRIAAEARAAAEAAEAERLRIVRQAEEAERAAARREEEQRLAAQREREASERREREAKERAERAEREAAEAARRAEAERVAAAERAERKRVAAVEAERRRQEQEAARVAEEARKREANKAHRAQINREAALDLQQRILLPDGHSLPKELAQAVIVAVAKGEIRHVSISY